MYGFFIILLFLFLGMALSRLTGGAIPGSVIGMVLMFVALSLKVVKPLRIRKAADFLINNMMLFFLPVGVGLITAYSLMSQHMWAILVAALVSTVIVIAAVGIVAQRMLRRSRKTGDRGDRKGGGQ